jgi:hypothetical protein
MQRFVESAPQSRDKMEAFMAQRPQQINQAVTEQMNRIAPPTQAPAMIGPDAAKAATSTINEVRAAINAGTKKMYDASGQTLVPPDIHASMLANTVFEDALKEVRASPYWRNKLGVQSDRSIAVYDAVKQELNERASQFANPTNPKVSAFKSSEAGSTAAETRAAAIEADKIATGGPSSYEAALQNQADLRQKWLTPLQQGPLGQIADAPTTQRAINALFPANAASVSATEVSDAVKGVARHNAQAAQQLVRQHLSMEINNAFEAASSPEAAQFAGARFAKNVAGSPVVAGPRMENLKAAVESLPGREGIWPGVQRMLEAAQATGWRAPKGSLTAFNLSEEKLLSTGGPVANIIKHAGSPGTWWDLAEHAIGRWQLRGNLNQVADIITDPKSTPIFRTLATLPPTSVRAQALVARLIAQNAITSSARSAEQIEAPKGQ